MTGMPITPDVVELARQRTDRARLDAAERAPKLHSPVAHTFSPFGGTGPPDSTWYSPANHATFDGSQDSQPWLCALDFLTKRALRVRIPWATGAGTTGEVRLAGYDWIGTTDVFTAAVALPANSSGTVDFKWLHGGELWTPGKTLYIEARRTGGAGDVRVGFPPGGLVQLGPEGTTVTGQ